MQASWEDPPEYRGQGGVQFAMPPLTPMVKRLILVNAAVFAVTFVLYLLSRGLWDPVGPFRLTIPDLFGIQPALWRDWFPLVPLWQLLSWGFLHSVTDPFHILGNMLFLYFLGTMLEELIGGRRLLAVYLSAVLITGLVTLVIGLVAGTSVPTLGASGAVLAIVVAMATLRPQQRIFFILFPITLRTLAFFYVGLDAYYMLRSLAGPVADNVAHPAHLSGALWGFLLVRRGWIWTDPFERVQAWRADRSAQRDEDDRQRLDRLLERIHKEGIGSLSASERAFLKRASKDPRR